MTKRAIAKAQLTNAFMFDSLDVGVSTLVPSEHMYFEAEFTAGRIADIHCYSRKRESGGKWGPWVYAWSVPSLMVKAYRWAESDIPSNISVPKIANAESEAEAVENGARGAAGPAAAGALRG